MQTDKNREVIEVDDERPSSLSDSVLDSPRPTPPPPSPATAPASDKKPPSPLSLPHPSTVPGDTRDLPGSPAARGRGVSEVKSRGGGSGRGRGRGGVGSGAPVKATIKKKKKTNWRDESDLLQKLRDVENEIASLRSQDDILTPGDSRRLQRREKRRCELIGRLAELRETKKRKKANKPVSALMLAGNQLQVPEVSAQFDKYLGRSVSPVIRKRKRQPRALGLGVAESDTEEELAQIEKAVEKEEEDDDDDDDDERTITDVSSRSPEADRPEAMNGKRASVAPFDAAAVDAVEERVAGTVKYDQVLGRIEYLQSGTPGVLFRLAKGHRRTDGTEFFAVDIVVHMKTSPLPVRVCVMTPDDDHVSHPYDAWFFPTTSSASTR